MQYSLLLQAAIHQGRRRSKMQPSKNSDKFELLHTAQKTILDMQTAKGLYGLTDSKLFWELQSDTRCLMGWNSSTIVLAFRGTASVTNALSDLQVLSLIPSLMFCLPSSCWCVCSTALGSDTRALSTALGALGQQLSQ